MPTYDELNESVIENYAEDYQKKYPEQIRAFESASLAARSNTHIGAPQVYALGKQLDQFTEYKNFCESVQSLGNMGQIPNIALDE